MEWVAGCLWNPQTLDSWLAGVTTVDGKDAKAAVLANISK
jgi:glycine betaine/proline transport system substrate-binding protein